MTTNESARGFWYPGEISLPAPLPEYNGGVIAFNNTREVTDTLKKWYSVQQETQSWLKKHLISSWVVKSGKEKWMLSLDQPGLRKIIWENKNIRVAVLPEEYNAFVFSGTRLWGKARIINGRGNLQKYANQMNRNPNPNRTYYQGFGAFRPLNDLSIGISLSQIGKMILFFFYLLFRKLIK